MLGEQRVVGPVAHEQREGVEVVVHAAGHRGRDQVGGLDEAADLDARFAEARQLAV